jgi:hypothetical protein
VAIAAGQSTLTDLTLDYDEGAWVLYVGAEDATGLGHRIVEGCTQAQVADPRLRLDSQAVVMTDMSAVLDLIQRARLALPAHAKVALIVLDTYNQTLGPGDEENSADTARAYTTGMRLLGRAFPGAAVITVHHPSAEGERLRGSTALENNVEFSIRFDREEGTMRTTLVSKKQKNASRFAPLTAAFATSAEGIVLGSVEAGAATASTAMTKPDRWTEARLGVLRTLYDARHEAMAYGVWRKRSGAASSTLRWVINELRDHDGLASGWRTEDEPYQLSARGVSIAEGLGPRWRATALDEAGESRV